MPEGLDPADWLSAVSDDDRLTPFVDSPALGDWTIRGPGRVGCLDRAGAAPLTFLPGRDLVRLTLERARDPIRDTVAAIAPLTRWLGPGMRHALLDHAAAEMTRHGWNPRNAFTTALRRELETQPSGIPPPRREAARLTGPELL